MSLLSGFSPSPRTGAVSFPSSARSARCAASARFPGLPGPALPDSYHLGQRRPEPQLERGVFSPLALPLGAAAVVSTDLEARFGVLPPTSGRRGHRRHPPAQDRTRDSASVLSTRSFVAAVSPQSGVGSALLAGFAAGTSAPQRSGRHARVTDSLPGSLASEAPRKRKPPTRCRNSIGKR